VDAAGNISITNSVSFTYVLSATLTVQTNGHGTLKPSYNNAVLEISNSYAMTATASQGYVFSNWTSSTGAVVTNGPELKFTMASNLRLGILQRGSQKHRQLHGQVSARRQNHPHFRAIFPHRRLVCRRPGRLG
jgi:hypothetical protein